MNLFFFFLPQDQDFNELMRLKAEAMVISYKLSVNVI